MPAFERQSKPHDKGTPQRKYKMNDLHKNEKIQKMINDITAGKFLDIRNLAEITLEFHDRLTELEKAFTEPVFVSAVDGAKPNILNQKPNETKFEFMQRIDKQETHLGMIDLDAYTNLQKQNESLKYDYLQISDMYWSEAKKTIQLEFKLATAEKQINILKSLLGQK